MYALKTGKGWYKLTDKLVEIEINWISARETFKGNLLQSHEKDNWVSIPAFFFWYNFILITLYVGRLTETILHRSENMHKTYPI